MEQNTFTWKRTYIANNLHITSLLTWVYMETLLVDMEIINKHTSSMFSSKIFSSMSETVSKTDTDAKSRWKRGGLGAALKVAKQNHLEAE